MPLIAGQPEAVGLGLVVAVVLVGEPVVVVALEEEMIRVGEMVELAVLELVRMVERCSVVATVTVTVVVPAVVVWKTV